MSLMLHTLAAEVDTGGALGILLIILVVLAIIALLIYLVRR